MAKEEKTLDEMFQELDKLIQAMELSLIHI